MFKVVFNACFGGFSLSEKAIKLYAELSVVSLECREEKNYGISQHFHYVNGEYFSDREISRHDENLVKVVETLGREANGQYAELMIEIVKGDRYIINEYDGNEDVVTPEKINWIIVK